MVMTLEHISPLFMGFLQFVVAVVLLRSFKSNEYVNSFLTSILALGAIRYNSMLVIDL